MNVLDLFEAAAEKLMSSPEEYAAGMNRLAVMQDIFAHKGSTLDKVAERCKLPSKDAEIAIDSLIFSELVKKVNDTYEEIDHPNL